MQITDEMVEVAADSDARFDGHESLSVLGRVHRDRYLARSRAALEAALGKDADAAPLSQVIGEIASELKCEHDNEAILAAIYAQSAEIARLREALEPFEHYYEINDCEYRGDDEAIEVPVGDLRRARAALETKG